MSTANEQRIRILLAEDHDVVRAGLAALLSQIDTFDVVGEAADGAQALALARDLRPDVVVLDMSLPIMSGLDVTRALVEELPECRILVLSMYGDDDIVSGALAAGAVGYVLKDEATNELTDAIRAVAAGTVHVSPMAARALVKTVQGLPESARGAARIPDPAEARSGTGSERRGSDKLGAAAASPGKPQRRRLTPRETQVLTLVAGGMSTKEVALELSISPKTADAHRQALMRKLDIHDVSGLVRYALRHGYIEL